LAIILKNITFLMRNAGSVTLLKRKIGRNYFSGHPHDEPLLSAPAPPQQLPLSPQVSGPPVSAAWIMAAAQPTPLFTRTASTGQFIWQAPHSMQASLLTSDATDFELIRPPALRSPIAKTA
jgi:hypothetical protein